MGHLLTWMLVPFAPDQRLDFTVGDGIVRERMGQQGLSSLDLEHWALVLAIKTDLPEQAGISIDELATHQRQITPAIAALAANLQPLTGSLPGEGTAIGREDIPDKKDRFTRINGMWHEKLHLVQHAGCR